MDGKSPSEAALIDELAGDLGIVLSAPPSRVEHRSGGTRISALRWGEGRPNLVLLHGGSLNAHAWNRVVMSQRLEALAVDLPGHGDSDWFAEPVYLPEDMVDPVVRATAALARAPVTLAGHSLGGLTALAIAARHPELVARLVLVDATPGSTPARSQDIVDFVSVREFDSFDAMLGHAAAYRPSRSPASLRRSLLLNAREIEGGRWTWRHDHRPLQRESKWDVTFRELPRGWGHAAQVRCPTLLVRGARSPIVLDSDVAEYRRLVEDLTVVEIAGAGHNIHGEAPAALGAAIAAFIDGTGGTT